MSWLPKAKVTIDEWSLGQSAMAWCLEPGVGRHVGGKARAVVRAQVRAQGGK